MRKYIAKSVLFMYLHGFVGAHGHDSIAMFIPVKINVNEN